MNQPGSDGQRPPPRQSTTRRVIGRFQEARPDLRERVGPVLAVVVRLAGCVGLVSLVAHYGTAHHPAETARFYILDRWLALPLALEAGAGVLLAAAPWAYVRGRPWTFAGLAVLGLLRAAAALAVEAAWLHPAVRLAEIAVLLVTIGFLAATAWRVALRRVGYNPALLAAGSFLLLILAGTGLLLLPRATVHGIAPLDALFTATSAVCVTGLTVVDTGTAFAPFGQAVILALIQAGGLGIMALSGVFLLAAGQGLGFRERRVLGDVLGHERLGDLGETIRAIIVYTLVLEALGFLAILLGGGLAGPGRPAIWWAAFHAVSAFCNAGFSLEADSLVRVPAVSVAAIGVLIVLGGLGIGVIREVVARARRLFPGRIAGRSGATLRIRRSLALDGEVPSSNGERRGFTVHTRLVLGLTLVLLLGGALAFASLEWRGEAFAGRTGADRVAAACFQSVTARTAGFHTVATSALGETSLFVTILLMFVGASPGSTGGGIKTVTLLVMLLVVRAVSRGRDDVEVLGRTLPRRIIRAAMVVVSVALGAVMVGTISLAVIEDLPIIHALFEATSAFATVGLSTGVTEGLSGPGKAVEILLMFLGRVGPLTLVVAVAGRRGEQGYRYPEEGVLVG